MQQEWNSPKPSEIRKQCYCFFSSIINIYLGRGNRKELPLFIVAKIRDAYPNEDQTTKYMGFKEEWFRCRSVMNETFSIARVNKEWITTIQEIILHIGRYQPLTKKWNVTSIGYFVDFSAAHEKNRISLMCWNMLKTLQNLQ